MDTADLTDSLNTLLEYLNDSHMGYEESANVVNDKSIAHLFNLLSAKRQKMAKELSEKINLLNSTPKKSGSLTGFAHRLFLDLKALVMGGNVDSIINEVKRGENTAINCYKEVLRKDLPSDLNFMLTNQLDEIEKDLQEMDKLSI